MGAENRIKIIRQELLAPDPNQAGVAGMLSTWRNELLPLNTMVSRSTRKLLLAEPCAGHRTSRRHKAHKRVQLTTAGGCATPLLGPARSGPQHLGLRLRVPFMDPAASVFLGHQDSPESTTAEELRCAGMAGICLPWHQQLFTPLLRKPCWAPGCRWKLLAPPRPP